MLLSTDGEQSGYRWEESQELAKSHTSWGSFPSQTHGVPPEPRIAEKMTSSHLRGFTREAQTLLELRDNEVESLGTNDPRRRTERSLGHVPWAFLAHRENPGCVCITPKCPWGCLLCGLTRLLHSLDLQMASSNMRASHPFSGGAHAPTPSCI